MSQRLRSIAISESGSEIELTLFAEEIFRSSLPDRAVSEFTILDSSGSFARQIPLGERRMRVNDIFGRTLTGVVTDERANV